jgi:hypothetical protein
MKKKIIVKEEANLKVLDDVEYIRTKKERYIRVSGYKYRWNEKGKQYKCSNAVCKGRVLMNKKLYYEIEPCSHKTSQKPVRV